MSKTILPQVNQVDENSVVLFDKDRADVRLALFFGGEPFTDFLSFVVEPKILNDRDRMEDLQMGTQLFALNWGAKFFLKKSLMLMPLLDLVKSDYMEALSKSQDKLYRSTGDLGLIVPEILMIPTTERQKLRSVIKSDGKKGKLPINNDIDDASDDVVDHSKGNEYRFDAVKDMIIVSIRAIIPRYFAKKEAWESALDLMENAFKKRSRFLRFIERIFGGVSGEFNSFINKMNKRIDTTFSATLKSDGAGDMFGSRFDRLFKKTINTIIDGTTTHTVIYIDDKTIEENPETISNFLKLASKVSPAKMYDVLGSYANFLIVSKKHDFVGVISDRYLNHAGETSKVSDDELESVMTSKKLIDSLMGYSASNNNDQYDTFQKHVNAHDSSTHAKNLSSFKNFGYVMSYSDASRYYKMKTNSYDDYLQLMDVFSSKVRALENPLDVKHMFKEMNNMMFDK